MHRRLCALGLAVVLLGGVAMASGVAASRGVSPTHEPAVMAARAHPAVAPLSTSRASRDRLPSLLALLAALLLLAASSRRADRPLSGPRLVEVAATHAPSRAPPSPQNFAF